MPAKPQLRIVYLEVRVPPHLSRELLRRLHEFQIDHTHVEFTQMRHKRGPRDQKLRDKHKRAVDALREIANLHIHAGVANRMRKVARDAVKEIA